MSKWLWGLAVLVALVGGMVWGSWTMWQAQGVGAGAEVTLQDGTRVLRVERLLLVDEKGQGRAQLSLEDGEPRLVFFDEERQVRVALGLVLDKPMLTLSNEAEQGSVVLGSIDGGPGVLFQDKQRQLHLVAGIIEGESGLFTLDGAGHFQRLAP